MRRVPPLLVVMAFAIGVLVEPMLGGGLAVVYTDILNVFTVNQRINAALGVNVAPGATGTISASDAIFERGRSVAIGDWSLVLYNAGNFTVPTGTWTVTSGNQTTYKYTLVGHTMFLELRLDGTTVTGTPASLRVAVPGGFTVAATTDGLCIVQANGVFQTGAWEAASGQTKVFFYTSPAFAGWVAGSANNSIIAKTMFEVL